MKVRWKTYFYYTEREKIGILLLLVLIVLLLSIRVYLREAPAESYQNMAYCDSIKQAFEGYQKSVQARHTESPQRGSPHGGSKGATPQRRVYSSERSLPQGKYPLYPSYDKKLSEGETIGLNTSDTSRWKKIPGVGSTFARRITKYRDLLGGFVSVQQLQEVYGMTDELLARIAPFVRTDGEVNKILVNKASEEALRKHPYISYRQARAIIDYRHRRGYIPSLQALAMLEEFQDADCIRLEPYLSFEY